MTLLFGEQASTKIQILEEQYRANLLQKVREHFKIDFPEYSPWMGLFRFEPQGYVRSICRHVYNNAFVLTDENHLRILSDLHNIDNGRVFTDLDIMPIMQNILPEHSKLIEDAREFLLSHSPYFSRIFKKIINVIIPLEKVVPYEAGMSCHYSRGALFTGIRTDANPHIKMAISLAHEFGHHVLMLYQACDSIIIDGQKNVPVFSPLRQTNRPSIQTFHAVVAMAYMTYSAREFLATGRLNREESKICVASIQKYSQDCSATISALKKSCEFTTLGNALCEEILQQTFQASDSIRN